MVQLDVHQHDWLKEPRLVRLMNLLNTKGEARLVGGCIRDCLLGKKPQDVDIATTLSPSEVKSLLPLIGATAAQRRDDHGSVLVVLEGRAFDVTTLRRDIKTTGRHAVVEFTKDWREDAQRRDFTINALYGDLNGIVYDPLESALVDLQHHRLAFIGQVSHRVQEDYLRILRYFRFLAQLNWIEDQETLLDLRPHINGLKILSKERIYHEFSRILTTEKPTHFLACMNELKIFHTLFDHDADLSRFEAAHQRNPHLNLIGRLLALCPASIILLMKKTDQRQAQIILDMITQENISYPHVIYFHGQEVGETIATLRDELTLFRSHYLLMNIQTFPVKSHDLDLHGPALGKALRAIESWWISQYCQPNQQACLHWFQTHYLTHQDKSK